MRQMWFGLLAITAGTGFYAMGCGDSVEQPTGSTSTGTSTTTSATTTASGTGGMGGAGGMGGMSSTSSAGGAGGGCATPSDCPMVDTECKTATCTQGVCGLANVADQTPVGAQTAGDCKKTVCDGQGSVVSINDDADVPDDANQCTGDTCVAGMASYPALAAGTLCAGGTGTVCDGAGKCVECLVNADCMSGLCNQTVCTPATCMDSLKNGAETDVDCGGPTCLPCAIGMLCANGADCVSASCANGVCAQPTCSDNAKNGTETDVDCGGTCATKCALTKACSVGTDCASTICTGGVCSQINGCDPTTALDKTGLAAATVGFGGGFGFAYSPKCIKVSVGTNVTLDGGVVGAFGGHPFVGGEVKGGAKVQAVTGPFLPLVNDPMLSSKVFTMTSAGTFPYYCDFHALGGMTGVVFVQ